MITDLLNEAIKELKEAAKNEEHPFRYCSVASCNSPENIRQRTMVLRGFSENENLLFYTDSRSLKIKHIKTNPQVSALFYNPASKLQLIIKGNMKICRNTEEAHKHKSHVEGKAMNNYNTKLSPGKVLQNPFHIDRTHELHFTLLELQTSSIEFLKIRKAPSHLRALFEKKESGWEKTFLVP